MANRIKPDIILEILRECKVPLRKYHIVYKCNLNDIMFTAYANSLMAKGLLIKVGDMYQTTPKGRTLVTDLLFLAPIWR
jgi:predicted transcriptional regulator